MNEDDILQDLCQIIIKISEKIDTKDEEMRSFVTEKTDHLEYMIQNEFENINQSIKNISDSFKEEIEILQNKFNDLKEELKKKDLEKQEPESSSIVLESLEL